MNELLNYLPVLNLLVIPVFMAYMRNEIRLTKIEVALLRIERELGFNDRRIDKNGES